MWGFERKSIDRDMGARVAGKVIRIRTECEAGENEVNTGNVVGRSGDRTQCKLVCSASD
jgi:hypothetical protein